MAGHCSRPHPFPAPRHLLVHPVPSAIYGIIEDHPASRPPVRRLTLVLACCVWPLAKGPAQQRALTLGEAIQLAVKADPSVVQAEGTSRTAGASVRSTWGEFLPRINSSASYGKTYSGLPSHVDPVTGQVISGSITSGSLSFGGNASIDIFTGFRRGADLSAARANVSDADASLADLRAQSALK